MTSSSLSAYQAFLLYESIRLHFKSDSYDYFRYNGKVKASPRAFDVRRDKYQFYKLSKKPDLIEYISTAVFLSYTAGCSVKWVGDLISQEVFDRVTEVRKGANNLSYTVEVDLARFASLDDALASRPNNLYEMWKRGDASVYSIIAIDRATDTLIDYWAIAYQDMFDQQKIKALKKYSPFVQVDRPKIHHLLTTTFI